MRSFNTAGPIDCGRHYCIDPLERLDLPEVLSLVGQMKYLFLHAPRQTGKTSCLLALVKHLNATGQYRALYANVEAGQSAREDVGAAMRTILAEIASRAQEFLHDRMPMDSFPALLDQAGPHGALNALLTEWATDSPLPLVLLMDEVDALVGDSLISVLRQLRSGYDKRPAHFPQSIILCGIRDVRDYRIHSAAEKTVITGGSAFNIRAESLRLGDFSREETEHLLAQHTQETGQIYEVGARDAIWELSCGQPWLVNALAYETCFRMKEGRDRARPIEAGVVYRAKENLILRRETHLDQLADKLQEERVRRVVGPLLEGEDLERAASPEDVQYVLDLGLIRRGPTGPAIANAIYREVIPRELTYIMQLNFESSHQPAWYTLPDGRLDMAKLLAAFQEYFRENSEHWLERFQYKEAGPQLLLQAFLQRIVNGGGRVEREYGLGRRRTDLLLFWPLPGGGVQKVVLELKILRDSLERTVAQGLEQTTAYMDRSGTREGHLVVFDRDPAKPWDAKVFRREETHAGHAITVWGM